MTLEQAISAILGADSRGANIQFAKSYAQAWLRGNRTETQLLYIRANLSGWRGATAKQVRAVIDAQIREARS